MFARDRDQVERSGGVRRRYRTGIGVFAGVALGLVCLWQAPARGVAAAPTPTAGVPLAADLATHLPLGGVVEHRYRIIGRVRLALFWASQTVGSARLTWRSSGGSTVIALLLGSDPQRAPRKLNQWGYVREESGPAHADAFALRSLDSGHASARSPISPGSGSVFGVSCSSISAQSVSSAATKVDARGVTYRMFAQLLDEVGRSPAWETRQTTCPAEADAGFLTALQRLLLISGSDATPVNALARATYVYDNTVYDLRVRNREMLGRTEVGGRVFDRLMRTDFAIRNRVSGDVTRFGVTHEPDNQHIPLPIQMFFQPNWWLAVELRLDDEADVPPDPAADEVMLARIRAMCASAAP